MSKSDAGKGDTPRPVNTKRFKENHDAIDWSTRTRKLQSISKFMGTMAVYQRLLEPPDWRIYPACVSGQIAVGGHPEGVYWFDSNHVALDAMCRELEDMPDDMLQLLYDWVEEAKR